MYCILYTIEYNWDRDSQGDKVLMEEWVDSGEYGTGERNVEGTVSVL